MSRPVLLFAPLLIAALAVVGVSRAPGQVLARPAGHLAISPLLASSLDSTILAAKDLPAGYSKISVKSYPTWVKRMQTPVDHCTTDKSLKKSDWKQAVIETAANSGTTAYVLICSYLTNSIAAANHLYATDKNAFYVVSGWKKQTISPIADKSFGVIDTTAKFSLSMVEYQNGNAVINVAQLVSTKLGPGTITEVARLAQLTNSRLK